jgi:DNA-binding SARP family transcriptional activator
MPTLHIHLLGDFRLSCDEAPVRTLTAPRLHALLSYLLLHRDAPQPRHHLAFLLWPDTTEAQARTNLRQLLHSLKQTLPAADHFVSTDATTVQWRHEAPFRLDVAEFEQACALAEVAAEQGDLHTLRLALEQASTLYHGDLLPSCYDDWILPERERLRQALTEALERLLLLLERESQPRAALTYAQRLLRHDPLREDNYRALMRLYAACGDRAGVLRVYHTCTSVLERELATEPSAATRDAYAQALAVQVQAQPVLLPQPSHTNLPIQLTSFVGRARELAELKRLLRSSRLLTLTGPGGTGKTRLALQLAADVQETFAAGVWLVELAALSDPTLVTPTIAAALGVREQPGRPLLDALLDYVRTKHLLLLLDNCEHLIESCAQLADTLLRVAPGLTIVASSREALGMAGETVYRVPSLAPRRPTPAFA